VCCNSDSHNKSLRVGCDSPLSKPRDAREDLVRGLRPDERLGFPIVDVEEVANGSLELRDAAMRSASNLFHGEFGDPAFDEIQPRAVGRREMDMKARTFGQPGVNQRGFMGVLWVP